MTYHYDTIMTNDPSAFDQVGDLFSKGIVATALSAGIGMANTGIALGNLLGADAKKIDAIATTRDIAGDEIADYYSRNQEVIDIAGLITSSIIPGTLAVRGLRAGQLALGNAAAREGAGLLTRGTSKLLVTTNDVAKLKKSIKAGNSLYSELNKARIIGGNFHQQALESLAFESAALLTNNQNSALNAENLNYIDTVADNLDTLAFGTIFGGVIGGAVGSLIDTGALKATQRAFEKSENSLKTLGRTGDPQVKGAIEGDNLVALVDDYKNTKLEVAGQIEDGIDPTAINRQLQVNGHNKRINIKAGISGLTKEYNPKDKGYTKIAGEVVEESSPKQIVDDLLDLMLDPNLPGEEVSKAFSKLIQIGHAGEVAAENTKVFNQTKEVFAARTKERKKFTRDEAILKYGDETPLERAYFNTRNRNKIERNAKKGLGVTDKTLQKPASSVSGMLRTLYNDISTNPQLVDEDTFTAILGFGSRPKIREMLSLGDNNVYVQTLNKEIDELIEKGMPEIFKSLNDLKLGKFDDAVELGDFLKHTKLHDPEQRLELAIKAFKVFDRGGNLGNKAPTLAKIFRDSSVESRFMKTDLYFNTQTRAFSVTPTTLRAADIAPMSWVNKTLRYGKGGNSIVSKTGQHTTRTLMAGESSVADVTAQWAFTNASVVDTKKLLNKNATRNEIDADDIPALQKMFTTLRELEELEGTGIAKVAEILEANPLLVNKLDAKGKVKQIEIKSVEQLGKELELGKVSSLLKLSAGKDGMPSKYSMEDITEILDVPLEWVERMGIKAADSPNDLIRGGNYNKTQTVKLTYDASDPERALAVGQGMAETNRRLQARRQEIGELTARYLQTESQLLPPNALQRDSNFNPTDTVSSVSEGQGLVKAFQATTRGEIFFQAIGKVTSLLRQKRLDTIGADLSQVGKLIQKDSEAVAELAVFNAKLAQGDYAIMHYDEFADLANMMMDYGDVVEGSIHLVPSKLAKMLREGDVEDAVKDFGSFFKWNGVNLDVVSIKNHNVADFATRLTRWNKEFVDHRNQLNRLNGDSYDWNPYTLPASIPDLKDLPELAKVQFIGHTKFGTGQGIIAARNAKELQDKIAVLTRNRNDIKVTPISQIERDAEVLGDFDFLNSMSSSSVNSDMRKHGLRWDVLPEADPRLVDNFVNAAVGRRFDLDRKFIKEHYGEDFRVLEMEDFITAPMSRAAKSSGNPQVYSAQRKMINAALGLQNLGEYSRFRSIQEVMGRAVDQFGSEILGATMKLQQAYTGVRKGKNAVDDAWKEITDMQKHYGLPEVYKGMEDYIASTSRVPKSVAAATVSKMNGLVSMLMLRTDQIQGMVNVLSSPITLMPALRELRQFVDEEVIQSIMLKHGGVKIPEQGTSIMSDLRIAMESVGDFFNNRELVKEYAKHGVISHDLRAFLEAVDGLRDVANAGDVGGINKFFGKIGKGMTFLSDKSEEFTRFVAARSAEKILDDVIKVLPPADAASLSSMKYSIMNSVSTKVHGNYVAAQRPTLFQGWMGQALGLFQTYQFNLIQSLFRGVERGDGKAVATMVGFQTGIFGAQSLPGFQLINQHIAQQGSEDLDMYSYANKTLGKDAAHWFLYGAASSAPLALGADNGINFYTRGDLTPRTPILIPTSPMEVPIANFLGKFVSNFSTLMRNLGTEAPDTTFYQFLAHNGMSRPISGLGQLMLGEKTSAQGTTVLSFDDMDNRLMHTLVKLAGTSTTDETIALDSFYRAKSYQSSRQAELNKLGQIVKNQQRAGGYQNQHDVMEQYVKTGGDGANFDKWYQNQIQNVDTPAYIQMKDNLNSKEGRYLQSIMD